jgi:hypothetical protein
MKIIIILMVVLVAGCGSYEDEKKEELFYCSMVESGAWPDYQGDVNCDEVKK